MGNYPSWAPEEIASYLSSLGFKGLGSVITYSLAEVAGYIRRADEPHQSDFFWPRS